MDGGGDDIGALFSSPLVLISVTRPIDRSLVLSFGFFPAVIRAISDTSSMVKWI
jgi:hypothetical protein